MTASSVRWHRVAKSKMHICLKWEHKNSQLSAMQPEDGKSWETSRAVSSQSSFDCFKTKFVWSLLFGKFQKNKQGAILVIMLRIM